MWDVTLITPMWDVTLITPMWDVTLITPMWDVALITQPFAIHIFSSIDGLICKQLEYFHSTQEKRQSYFTSS
jgi:hypothetical protein